MSSVYVTEPITNGRIIIETTYGPIDILLWCNECPITTQYFIQLCIDGYYNNMIFHRIIPNLLIQTGTIRRPENEHNDQQPNTTTDMNTNEMIQYRNLYNADNALERYPYEVNSRIRFNHRGQVAMALQTVTTTDNDDMIARTILQPQFFITTATDAEYLNNQHVIIGTLGNSPTIFNVIRINEQTEIIDNVPADMYHAPRITGIKIIENIIHKSIQPTTSIVLPWIKLLKQNNDDKDTKKNKRKNRIGKFDMNVLSFGDEAIIDDNDNNEILKEKPIIKKKKNHQPMTTIEKTNLKPQQQQQDHNNDHQEQQKEQQSSSLLSKTTTSSPTITATTIETDHNNDSIDHNDNVEQQQQQQQQQQLDDNAEDIVSANHVNENNDNVHQHRYISSSTNNDTIKTKSIPDIKLQPQKEEIMKNKNDDNVASTSTMSAVEKHRAKYLTNKSRNKQQRDDDTMSKLIKFKGKVCTKNPKLEEQQKEQKDNDTSLAARMARRVEQQEEEEYQKRKEEKRKDKQYYRGQILVEDNNNNDNDSDWYKTRFQCKKNGGSDGRHMDDYEVVDEKRKRRNSKDHNRHNNNNKHHKHHHSSKSKNK